MPLPHTTPFYIHALLEVPASLNFFLNPSSQLPFPAPQAHAVIRQYAILLLASSLIALIFALRPIDGTSRNVAGALAVYHLAPAVRAAGRIWEGTGGEVDGKGLRGLGGPWVHWVAHSACLGSLVLVFLTRDKRRRGR